MSWELTIEDGVQRWARIGGNYYYWSDYYNRWIECLAPARVVTGFDERLAALRAFREPSSDLFPDHDKA